MVQALLLYTSSSCLYNWRLYIPLAPNVLSQLAYRPATAKDLSGPFAARKKFSTIGRSYYVKGIIQLLSSLRTRQSSYLGRTPQQQSGLLGISILSVRWSRFINRIPPKTHLASLISPLIIRITNSATYFSLKVYISTYINFLNSLLENYNGNKEG